MATVGSVIGLVLWAAILVLIARFVIDWVQMLSRSWRPRGPVLVVCEVIFSATDPPLRAVRRVVPPMRFGQVAVDLSAMILLIGLYLLQIINSAVFF